MSVYHHPNYQLYSPVTYTRRRRLISLSPLTVHLIQILKYSHYNERQITKLEFLLHAILYIFIINLWLFQIIILVINFKVIKHYLIFIPLHAQVSTHHFHHDFYRRCGRSSSLILLTVHNHLIQHTFIMHVMSYLMSLNNNLMVYTDTNIYYKIDYNHSFTPIYTCRQPFIFILEVRSHHWGSSPSCPIKLLHTHYSPYYPSSHRPSAILIGTVHFTLHLPPSFPADTIFPSFFTPLYLFYVRGPSILLYSTASRSWVADYEVGRSSPITSRRASPFLLYHGR